MSALRQARTNFGVLRRAREHRLDLLRALARRPQLLVGTAMYEVGIALSARTDPRLKLLAELKVAALIACQYCLDIGSELSRMEGLDERQLRELADYRASDAFDEVERTVLELAERMTIVPVRVPDELRERLDRHLTKAQQTELAAVIAWENQRGRLNQALGVRPSNFSGDAYCLLAEAAPVP